MAPTAFRWPSDGPSDPPGHRPERYRLQVTIRQEAADDLRCLQTLLRREFRDGDPAVIVERALRLLRETVEKRKLGAGAKRRLAEPRSPIRSGTDTKAPSRHVPQEVKRAVSERDGGQCAFVSKAGRRCSERTFLEFHHIRPYARHGPTTVENIALRCRRHNDHEAELVFGTRRDSDEGLIDQGWGHLTPPP
jgi:hypothetical protein